MNDLILKKIQEIFPNKNFTIKVEGNLSVIYLDDKKLGVSWANANNPFATSSSNQIESLSKAVINNINKIFNGNVIGSRKTVKEEDIPPSENNTLSSPSDTAVVEEPVVIKKKKTSKKKKVSEESKE